MIVDNVRYRISLVSKEKLEKSSKETERAKKEAEKQLSDAREEAIKISDTARHEDQTRRKEVKNIETFRLLLLKANLLDEVLIFQGE